MNLVVHIMRKDFAQLRPFAWAALLLQGVVPLLAGSRVGYPLNSLQLFCVVVHFGVVTCGTALLVHEDPVAGPRGRWITMPIPGGRLLAAKLASIGLFFWLIPSVVQLFVSLIAFGSLDFIAVASGNLLITITLTTTALLLASLTNSLSRFLLWMMLAVLAQQFLFRPACLAVSVALSTEFAWVVSVVGGAGLQAFLLLVALNQFRTRRPLRALAFLLFGLGGLVWGAYETCTLIEPRVHWGRIG